MAQKGWGRVTQVKTIKFETPETLCFDKKACAFSTNTGTHFFLSLRVGRLSFFVLSELLLAAFAAFSTERTNIYIVYL